MFKQSSGQCARSQSAQSTDRQIDKLLTWAVSKFGLHQLQTVSSTTQSTGGWSDRPNIYTDRQTDRHRYTCTDIHRYRRCLQRPSRQVGDLTVLASTQTDRQTDTGTPVQTCTKWSLVSTYAADCPSESVLNLFTVHWSSNILNHVAPSIKLMMQMWTI